MNELSGLILRTKKQDKIIAELMESIKRLQIYNEDLKRARLTIGAVIKVDGGTQEKMMVTSVHRTDGGIVVRVVG